MHKTNWNLDNILHIDDFDLKSKKLEIELKEFSEKFNSMPFPISKEYFSEIISAYILITENIAILYARAFLAEELNNIGEDEKFLKSKAHKSLILYENTIRPFIHWIEGLEKNNNAILNDLEAKKLFKSLPSMEYYFTKLRELKKHTLSLDEEKIIAHKYITGTQTVLELRSIIENEQRYEALIDGKLKKFDTMSSLAIYFKDGNKENRINSYNALYDQQKKNIVKYFSIYKSIVNDWSFETKLRNYDSNISVVNVENDIKDKTVDILLNSCEDNKDIFNEFFLIKAKELKIPKLTRYDLYSPIAVAEKTVSYEEAVTIILDVFKGFDSELYNIAVNYFDTDNIDCYPKSNKTSGAFCANITNKIDPYLLLNFTNKTRDVFILAHEFGHATHQMLSKSQNILTQDAPLTLAETASTFTESLVFDYLYKNEKDKNVKKSMLFEKITDTYATIAKQAYTVKFEKQAHKLLEDGIKLEDFNDVYLNVLREQFGDYIEVPEIFKYEWSYIPHIVNTPFYCYAYPFGDLLSFSLYESYLENKGSFINKYKNILKAGGSQNPYKLLKKEGFNIEDPQFFNNGFKIIKKWIKELESLI